jgi:hypothetical protein
MALVVGSDRTEVCHSLFQATFLVVVPSWPPTLQNEVSLAPQREGLVIGDPGSEAED